MASSALRTGCALILPLGLVALLPFDALARGGRGYSSAHSAYSSGASHRSSIKCQSCPRDSQGRIQRDPKAVEDFKRTHPKPPGCDHCEVDHIIPLSKGGRDDPRNMQGLPRVRHRDTTRQDLGR